MIEAYFDGCCEPVNPGGVASFGAVILKDGIKLWECSQIFYPKKGKERETSNNVAEYSGFKAILEYLIQNSLEKEKIHIFGDSNLVIQQMFGTWRIRQGFYVPLAFDCLKLVRKFKNLKGSWIPREENGIADELSKAKLIKAGVEFRIQPNK